MMSLYRLLAVPILMHLLAFNIAYSTIFIPTPIDQQLENVNAVIRAEYQGETSRRLVTGDVVTELTFKLKFQAGLSHREIINPNNFKVLVPGGTFDGIVYFVHGAPKFKLGEESILFITKGQFGFQLYNLGLGKYNIIQNKNEFTIRSEVFPGHPELGNISYKNFNTLIENKFGIGLSEIEINYTVQKNSSTAKLESSRYPSSLDGSINSNSELESENGEYSLIFIFLMMSFGTLGFIATKISRRKS